ERRDDTEAEERRSEPFRPRHRALVAFHQPGHGERHVEHVLEVVIGRVARVEARKPAAVESVEIVERLIDRRAGAARVEPGKNAHDLRVDGCGIGYVDLAGYVQIVALTVHRVAFRGNSRYEEPPSSQIPCHWTPLPMN